MNKAFLIIDMPSSCKDCDIMFKDEYSDWCPHRCAKSDVYDYVQNNTKPDWCPLKLLPVKHDLTSPNISFQCDFESGYNKCIDEILGE